MDLQISPACRQAGTPGELVPITPVVKALPSTVWDAPYGASRSVLLIFSISLAVWVFKNKFNGPQCGNVKMEGYLVEDCPLCSALPWIQEDNGSSRCYLDLRLLKDNSETQSSLEVSNSSRETDRLFTSSCFLETLGGYELLVSKGAKYNKLTLVGKYKKVNVCSLLEKCLEPRCRKCGEADIFIPCDVN